MSSQARLEQLVLNRELKWVFFSVRSGLLIATEATEDFRLIHTWTTSFTDSIYCDVLCSDTHYPTKAPTSSPSLSPSLSPETSIPTTTPTVSPSAFPSSVPTVQPSEMPTKKTRYPIEVEHHLNGVSAVEWEVFQVQPVYVQALAFTFSVPESEIEVTSVESIEPVRRLLQDSSAPSLMVKASVGFTDHKRFSEYRDILESPKGRGSLNNYFNFLLTDKESQLDNLDVQHMGIEGDFDMVSYFTTVPPTQFPSDAPTPYVDNGDAVNIQDQFQATSLVLNFEGAVHDDAQFHQRLTELLNAESVLVADTEIVSSALEDDGTHTVTVNLDCNFYSCALQWRNDTKMDVVAESLRQSDDRFSEFRILSADVGKLDDSEMEVVEITTQKETYLLLFIGVTVVFSCVMCWKYWKVLFLCNKKSLDITDYVDEVIAVPHNQFNSTLSLSSVYATDSEAQNEFIEGCETLAVYAAEANYAQPAAQHADVDVEGFAPTQPMFEAQKRMAGGESESMLYERRKTQECNVDVYVNSPSMKRVASTQKRKLATFGTGLSESDTDITLYGDHQTATLQSDEETTMNKFWSPRTAKSHNMWE